MRHLLTLADLTAAEIERIFSITEDLKSKYRAGAARAAVARPRDGPAVREAVAADPRELRGRHGPPRRQQPVPGQRRRLRPPREHRRFRPRAERVRRRDRGPRQPPPDASSSWPSICTCSVINGLTDFGHPCQALADLYTLRELVGPLEGQTLAWIGDANNVARSLADRLRQAGHAARHGHAARATSSTTKSLGLAQAARRPSST